MEKNVLDLNAYGVEEMSSVEMRETDGGFFKAILIMVAVGAFMDELASPNSFTMDGAFMQGINSGWNAAR